MTQSLLERSRRIGRALRNAFFSYGFRRFGLRFAADYLRLAGGASRRWNRADPGTLGFLGYRIVYQRYSAAFFLIHEVFVNGAYAFEADTRRPRIIDCGANIGMSVLFFKTVYPDSEVIAFEADPRTFQQLTENVTANHLTNVRTVNAAVAPAAGVVSFYSTEQPEGSLIASLDPALGGTRRFEVPAIALSTVAAERVDLLKMDIEGGEFLAVGELVDSGAIRHVEQIVLEYHELDGDRTRVAHLAARLEECGMVVKVTPGVTPGRGLVAARRGRTEKKAGPEEPAQPSP